MNSCTLFKHPEVLLVYNQLKSNNQTLKTDQKEHGQQPNETSNCRVTKTKLELSIASKAVLQGLLGRRHTY